MELQEYDVVEYGPGSPDPDEHEMVQHEAGDEYREHEKLAAEHQELNGKHQDARSTHAERRERHLKMMAELKKLIEEMNAITDREQPATGNP